MKNALIYILATIIVFLIVVLGGIVCWQLGRFIIWAFKINYNWTFWCGLATQVVLIVVTDIFRKIGG